MALTSQEIPNPKAVQRIIPKTVEQSVYSLLKWRNSKLQSEKPKLFDPVDEFVYLVLTLKKIPPNDRVKPYRVPLPHSLASEFSEHCLIIDDRPNSGLSKEEAQKKIKAEFIPVAKVLKLSKLKANYQAHEAKRKLCDSYNLFFTDRRVIPLLPRLIGKKFFKKKKIPIALDLKHKNWKEQIEKACRSALLFLSTGTCAVVKVAKPSMGADEIVENVVAAINGIVELVPKKWNNVRSLHLKLLESISLPLYQALPDYKLKIEGVKSKEESAEEEEGTEASGDESKKGEKVRNKKGRIHEVKYMDSNVGDLIDDELGVSKDAHDRVAADDDVKLGGGEDSEADAVMMEKKVKKKTKSQDALPTEMKAVKRMKTSSIDEHEDGGLMKDKSATKENKVSVVKCKKVLTSEDGVSPKKKDDSASKESKVSVVKGKKILSSEDGGTLKINEKSATKAHEGSVVKNKKVLTSEDGDTKDKKKMTWNEETKVKAKRSKKSA